VSHDFYAPRAQVRVSGLTLAADLGGHLISVSYDNNLDIADMFTIVLLNEDGKLTDSSLFALGSDVEVHMGYGNKLEPMILGEIASLQPSFPEGGPQTLTISGYDKSQPLRHNEPLRELWQYTNDSLIATEIAATSGLIPVVDPSPYSHEEIVQTSSDFAFLKERAQANFFDVWVHWDRLYFQLRRPQTEAYRLEWRRNLSSFAPRLASSGADSLQIVRGYNEELAEAVVGLATTADLNLDDVIERLGSGALDTLVTLGRRALRSRASTQAAHVPEQQMDSADDAYALARATLETIFDGLYEGSGSCVGIPELRASKLVAIEGIGRRFSGKYRIRRATHTLDDGGYRTTFEVSQRGGSSLLPLLRKTLTEEPPPNRQRRTVGITIGKVVRNVDPKHMGRVKVSYPLSSDESESVWARCLTPMGGAGLGLFFLPEEKQEVLVGFQEGRKSAPIVLGSLWNGPAPPPVDHQDGANAVRVLKTKSGHVIELDDTKKNEHVRIKHSSGSTITLAADGSIMLDSKKNLDLTASGNVTITAANVDVKVARPNGAMNVTYQ
jgi:phage protein D